MKYNISITGEIGYWPNTVGSIRYALNENAGKHVDLYINSLGGSLSTGLQIRQLLIDHGDVTVYIDGFTASAATLIAMGANKIVMSKYASVLIHQCSNWIDEWGMYNADELKNLIAKLEKNVEDNETFDHIIASVYADRTGKTAEEIRALMKTAKWMLGEEALSNGLVDEVSDFGAKPKVSNSVVDKFNKAGVPLPENSFDIEFSMSEKIAETVVSGVRSLINGLLPQKNSDSSTNSNNPNPMAKTTLQCAALAAVLGVESVEAEDNVVALSADQVNAVEARLAELQNQIDSKSAEVDSLNQTIAEKDAEIENFKAAPAAEPEKVLDQSKNDEQNEISIADIQNAINNKH